MGAWALPQAGSEAPSPGDGAGGKMAAKGLDHQPRTAEPLEEPRPEDNIQEKLWTSQAIPCSHVLLAPFAESNSRVRGPSTPSRLGDAPRSPLRPSAGQSPA